MFFDFYVEISQLWYVMAMNGPYPALTPSYTLRSHETRKPGPCNTCSDPAYKVGELGLAGRSERNEGGVKLQTQTSNKNSKALTKAIVQAFLWHLLAISIVIIFSSSSSGAKEAQPFSGSLDR